MIPVDLRDPKRDVKAHISGCAVVHDVNIAMLLTMYGLGGISCSHAGCGAAGPA